MADEAQPIPRWTSRPVQASVVRAVELVTPPAVDTGGTAMGRIDTTAAQTFSTSIL